MPVVAAGTAGYQGENASLAVRAALAAGFTHLHTAYDYYNLKAIGDGLRSVHRRSYFLSGMTAPCIHAAPPKRNVTSEAECFALTYREASSMLAELFPSQSPNGSSYLDLLMLHGPSEVFGHEGGCSKLACALARAQWRAYERLLREGTVRAIGVSNFCQSCLACLESIPATNQVQLHVGQGSADPGPGLISYCAQRGIVVQSYEPLAGGALATDPFCQAIGLKHNKSAAQVALRWVLQRAPSLAVRAGASRHLRQDLDLFDFELDGSDLLGLDARAGPAGEAGGRCSWGCTE